MKCVEWSRHVAARETIRVIAGEFDSYRIVCDQFSEYDMRILRRRTWHYSPAVGYYMRREVKNFSTDNSHYFKLVAALPSGKGNTLRVKSIIEVQR